MAELSLPWNHMPPLKGDVEVPGSKSISNRLLLMNHMASRPTNSLQGLSTAGDTVRMQAVLHKLTQSHTDGEVMVGDAGTVMRFVLPLLCMSPGIHRMTGTERAHERPMGPLVDALRLLGARIEYLGTEGCLPLKVVGGTALKMPEGLDALPVDAGMSSQFVSALLLVAPYTDGGLRLRLLTHSVSRPYLHLTLGLMREWGIPIEIENENNIKIYQSEYLPPARVEVEPDWSSAAYWLAWAALMPQSELFIPRLKRASLQADATSIDAFSELGVQVVEKEGGLLLLHRPVVMPDVTSRQTADASRGGMAHNTHLQSPNSRVTVAFATKAAEAITSHGTDAFKALHFCGVDAPDLMPTALILCALKNRAAQFSGMESLRVKESDRLTGLLNGLHAAGATVIQKETGTYSLVRGIPRASIQGQIYELLTQGDHRMAMAFSLLASQGYRVRPDRPDVVDKSYPNYWNELKRLGMVWQR